MKVGVLAYDGCLGGEVFGFADVLHLANRAAATKSIIDDPPFEICLVGARSGQVTATHDVTFRVAPAPSNLDILAVPAFDFADLSDLDRRLEMFMPEVKLLQDFVGRVHIAGICTGSFLLGQAGLLDGRRATTAWLFAPELARRYPAAHVDPEALLVEDRGVTTTGAFSAAHDLAVKLIRENADEALARAVGRMALLETGRVSQSAYVDVQMFGTRRAPFARSVRQLLERRIADPYNLTTLAHDMNVSSRTLLRRFKAETGYTPLEELQALRIARAKRLLESTTLGVGEIALNVGYQDLSTFVRLFVRLAEVTPAVYRRRFRIH
jgi:transcriptional regulator GlxA family with amidase domain